MLDWEKIDTVLLDMDGTLLDLSFDNHFWKEFVPLHFAKKQGLSIETAKLQLEPGFKNMEGKLEWYCLDYWSEVLELDIAGLKAEVSMLIKVLPFVVELLEKIHQSPKKVFLVTNAHRDSLALKMEKTCLGDFFDGIVSAHDFGFPKEQADFWHLLQALVPFDKQSTLLIDDNLAALHSARQFGIAYLIAVSKPDTGLPKKVITGFPAIEDFRALMTGL